MNPPSLRKTVFAWCVYDFANTIHSALFITFFFPVFIKVYAGGDESQIGFSIAVSTILSALVVPVVGALSDQIGRRMPFLIAFTVGCCACTAAVAFSSLAMALILAVAANFFYSISLAVYDALLPKLADEKTQGSVSGWGVGVGYLGTPFSLVALSIWMSFAGWDTEFGVRGVFVLTAVLFMSISLYPFLVIREPRTQSGRRLGEEVARAFGDIGRTLATLPSRVGFLAFLATAFLFFNAIMAVVVFLYLYGEQELGLTQQNFVMIYAGMALAAALGSWIAGKLTDRLGPKRVLTACGLVWIAVLVAFIQVHSLTVFIVLGCIGGAAMAAYQAASRPFLIQFADPEQMGEYFGFLALINKASGAVGPAAFGWLAKHYGYTSGLYCLIGFFVCGLICLIFAPDKRWSR